MSYATRFGIGLLAASMEEDEVIEEVVEEMDNSDNVEASLIETADAADEVTATQDAIEDGVAAADTLDEVADTLEETEQDGGADPVTAKVAEVAIEAIYTRLGLVRKTKVSFEDFADVDNRVRATRISVEEIREKVAKIWEGIKALLARLVEWVKETAKKMLSSTERLKARAEKIKAAAGSATGRPGSEPLTGSFIGVLRNKDHDNKAAILRMLSEPAKPGKDADDVFKLQTAYMSVDVAELVKNKEAFDNFSVTDALDVGTGGNVPSGSWYAAVRDRVYKARNMEILYFGTSEAAGGLGYALVVPNVKADVKGAEAMAALSRIKIISAPVDQAGAKDAKLEPLSAKEAETLADNCLKLVEGLEAAKPLTDGSSDEMTRMLRSDIAGAVSEDDKDAEKRARSVTRLITGLSALSTGLVTVAIRNALSVANAALTYAELSVRALSTEEDEEFEDAVGDPSETEEVADAEAGAEETAEEETEEAGDAAETAQDAAEDAAEAAEDAQEAADKAQEAADEAQAAADEAAGEEEVATESIAKKPAKVIKKAAAPVKTRRVIKK